jgi:hypothetical protein
MRTGEFPGGQVLTRDDFVKKPSEEPTGEVAPVEYQMFRISTRCRSDEEFMNLLNLFAREGWKLRAVADGDLAIFDRETPFV